MNKPELLNKKNAKNILIASLTGLAIIGSEQTASAHTPQKPAKAPEVFPQTKKHLQQYLEAGIRLQEAVPFFHGKLIINDANNTGGVEAQPNSTGGTTYLSGNNPKRRVISYPIVENIGPGEDIYDEAAITSRTYFGSLTQDAHGKVRVHLNRFDPKTMRLETDNFSNEPIGSVAFQSDKAGTINLMQPFSGLYKDQPSHALTDPAGNTLRIGFEYNPNARG